MAPYHHLAVDAAPAPRRLDGFALPRASLWGRRAGLVALVLLAAYVATASYLVLRLDGSDGSPDAFRMQQRYLPWGGPSWRDAARATARQWSGDPGEVDALLALAATRYPLDAPLWLDRAEVALATGAPPARVAALIDTAVAIMPAGRKINWRAAMIALRAGRTENAEHYLRRYLIDQPGQVGKAASIVQRWIETPDALIDRLLPPGPTYLGQLLRFACRTPDPALAQAAWERLADEDRVGSAAGIAYVNYLLQENRGAEAATVWQGVEPGYRPSGLHNGDFSSALGNLGGLDWRIRPAEGVTIGLHEDAHVSPPTSLEIRFDGEHNADLNGPMQLIPVVPGRSYVLSGKWRGRGLTTRVLPSILVVGYRKGGLLGKAEAPAGGDWPWQELSIPFKVPQDLSVVYLTVRRPPTDRFDRFIKGQLLLDDLTLAPVDESPS